MFEGLQRKLKKLLPFVSAGTDKTFPHGSFPQIQETIGRAAVGGNDLNIQTPGGSFAPDARAENQARKRLLPPMEQPNLPPEQQQFEDEFSSPPPPDTNFQPPPQQPASQSRFSALSPTLNPDLKPSFGAVIPDNLGQRTAPDRNAEFQPPDERVVDNGFATKDYGGKLDGNLPKLGYINGERVNQPDTNYDVKAEADNYFNNQLQSQPPNAPTGESPAAPIMPTIPKSQQTQNEINEITGKKYGLQRDAEGNIMRGADGKPLHEKDRNRKWSTWEKIGGALLGAMNGIAQTGNIGGGIAGAIGGGIDRNYIQKNDDRMKLNRLMPQLKQQQQSEDFQTDQTYRQTQIKGIGDKQALNEAKHIETQKKNVDLQYDRGFRQAMTKIKLGYKKGENASLDADLSRYGINIEQWDDNKRTFWQGQNLMTFNEKGETVPVTNEKGETVTDITRTPVTVEYDGQKFTVSQTKAFEGLTTAGKTNTGIVNQDINDDNDYQTAVQDRTAKIAAINGEIEAQSKTANNLEIRNKELEQEKSGLDLESYEGAERLKQIDTEIKSNIDKWRTAKADVIALEGKRNIPMPAKPKPRQKVDTPKVTQSVSEEVFRARLEANKIPASKHAAIIAKAKRDGVIK